MTSRGDSGEVRYNNVPNYGNYKTHNIPDENMSWYIANILYMKRSVADNGPSAISNADAAKMINILENNLII